jgi:tetratricopeptide repeat protein 8
MGLCCYYSAQYDMALSCFERALASGTDETKAEVWYNVGHVGIGIGDLGLAY